MKHRTRTTLVALALLGWWATRSEAISILVTENITPTSGDFKLITGVASGVVQATVSTNIAVPFGITTDTTGNIYVVNNSADAATINSIAKFTSNLAPNGFFVAPGVALNSPIAMAIKPTTQNAYITNIGPPTAPPGSVLQQSVSAPAGVTTFTDNANAGNVANPFGVAFNTSTSAANIAFNPSLGTGSPNPYMYVTNEGATQTGGGGFVNIYNTALQRSPIATFGSGVLFTPTGIAFDVQGNAYVSNINPAGSTIQKFSPNGTSLGAFIASGLSSPVGLAFDPLNGDLYVANNGTGNIARYNSAGTLLNATWATGLTDIRFLTISAVPEPSSIVMLGLGQVGLLAFCLHRNRRKVARAA